MNEFFIFSIPLTLLFGTLAVYFSYREEKRKMLIDRQNSEIARRLYQISLLNNVSDKIGYSLNVADLAETIVLTVEQLLNVTTIAYALIQDHTIETHLFMKEQVSGQFLQQVQNIMLGGCYGIDNSLNTSRIINNPPQMMKNAQSAAPSFEKKEFIHINQAYYGTGPQSYFNIPLIINNKFVGIITITSKMPKVFSEEDMVLLYKTVSQAESAIEKLEEVIEIEKSKLDSLILSLPSGALLFLFENGTLQLSTINSAAKEFLKLTGEPDMSQVLAAFGQNNTLINQIKDALRDKKTIFSNELEVHERYFKIFIIPVFEKGHDNLIGVSLTLQDITQEKETEKLRENFTNMVVHELRAPLTSIKGASTLLLSKNTLQQQDRDKMLQIIKDSTERMLNDIGDLLDAAKMDAGRFTIMKQVSNINKVIQERVDLFSSTTQTKRITINLAFDETIPQFEFDPARIGQVVNNLLSNSIKFTAEGGIITLKTRREGQFLRVMISDTGVGIPSEQKSILFSKFGQIQKISGRQGTGLGLYISKGIIKSHGGEISIDSQEGQGTIVSFTIPILNPQPQATQAGSLETQQSTQPSLPHPLVN